MSLYAEYVREREGLSVLEDDKGFAVYRIGKEECYISEIYVRKEHRKTGYASFLADKITEEAKLKGCTLVTGSVDPSLDSATASMKVLLGYGMKVHGIIGPLIYFKKEI